MQNKFWPVVLSLSFLMIMGGCLTRSNTRVDKNIGAEAAQEVEAEMGHYKHPYASPLIEDLGSRLVKQLGDQPFDYTFHIVDTEEPNAFAILGGHVYFSRGIILLARTEDELAGVMGHEIIHVDRRHTMRQARRGIIPGILKLPGNIIGNVASENLGSIINSPFNAMTARYGRSQETEADRLGIKLAAGAGYEPHHLANLLQRLSDADTLVTGEEERFGFLDTHPYTPDRARDINKRSKRLIPSDMPPLKKSQEDFLRTFEGLLIGPNPAQGIFDDNVFVHPELGMAIDFPKGWDTINTSSFVGAGEPHEEAQLILGIVGEAGDPTLQADKVKKRIKKKFKSEFTNDRPVDVNGNPGYYLSLPDRTTKNDMVIHLLWLSKGAHMYQFTGIGYDRHKEAMRKTVLSLRPISQEDRAHLKQTMLKVVLAQEGETIEALSKRSKNVMDIQKTALMNDVSLDQKLPVGYPVKIGVKVPY
jgi:predicted Zn-dependent protease